MSALRDSILVVDDSPEIIDILGEILRPIYQVKFALSGPDALILAQTHPPSLILLDLLMPGMSGHEVCRRLKADPATRDIPVIFLTGSSEARDEQLGLELGAVDYLHKPPNPPLVLQRVRIHLELHNQNLTLERKVQERTRQLEDEIAERKQAEAALQRLNHALMTISRCNEVLVHATDEGQLLRDMCRTIVEVGTYPFAWVGYADNDERKSVHPVARFGGDCGHLDQAAMTWTDDGGSMSLAGRAIRSGTIQVSQNLASDSLGGSCRNKSLKCRYSSCIALPLTDEFGIFGALTLYTDEPEAFDQEEVDLLAELAKDLAYGIGALRIKAERDQAIRDLQLTAKVFEESKEAILITDADNRILAVNGSFTRITGFTENEVLGELPRMIQSERHDADFFNDVWATVDQKGQWMGEIWNRRKNGEAFPALESISAIRNPEGVLTHYVRIFADVTPSKESEERIRFLTQHDALTGLANRSLLIDRLEQAIIHARRKDRLVAVMFINMDRFKLVNDSLGHDAGNAVLKQVAERLSAFVRPGDTVARPGGDEFALVMSDMASENDAAFLARNLFNKLAAPMLVNDREIVVTASLGLALFPRDGDQAELLLKHANVALHRAKEVAQNNIQFYAPEMNARMLERLELETGLHRAIERGEFLLNYQPKVELTQGQIIGAEALIRWQHPSLGLITPVDFIPLAEETGQIVQIGEWVIRTACRQLKTWQQEGFSDIVLAVNLSARQFQQDNIIQLVADALAENGVRAQSLELEVTESAVMQNPERTVAILHGLKRIGVSIALDDFGTGYSSLSYLKRFPIDHLKIDQSFVQDITSDPEDTAIACSVISLAHSLKLRVIAEGVETEAQLTVLRRHRCDQIQGYYFSRPLAPEEFTNLLRTGRALEIGLTATGEQERTLLLVDDEQNILSALRRLLRRDGYRILTASSAAEAFELLALNPVQVIVSDQRMPQMSGTEFLSRVKEMYPDTIRLVLSGYTELESITAAINHGAIYKFLTKPWDDSLLREHIREAFTFYESKRDKLRPGNTEPRETTIAGA